MVSQQIPSFAIVGFMKSGTTYLRNILTSVDGVSLPAREVHSLSLDDEDVHPDFFVLTKSGNLIRPTVDMTPGSDWSRWRQSIFRSCASGSCTGEDSTMYAYSDLASSRARHAGFQKAIFVIRDPRRRAWSDYWHLVRSGRLGRPSTTEHHWWGQIAHRSSYTVHIGRWTDALGAQNVLLIDSERLFARTDYEIDRCLEFLGTSDRTRPRHTRPNRNGGGAPVSWAVHRRIAGLADPRLRYWGLRLLPESAGSVKPDLAITAKYRAQSRLLRASCQRQYDTSRAFPTLEDSLVAREAAELKSLYGLVVNW